MSEYQNIPARIRALVAAPGPVNPRVVADVAARYGALCAETLGRLRRCDDYLRRGLRSEAVHLSQCPPDLLDVVPYLEFPEADAWAALCAANDLTVELPFKADGLGPLTAARVVEQSLETLLSRHRALGLARAAAGERAVVLRALIDADPSNPVWPMDLRDFESARLRDMHARAAAAHAAHDVPALEALGAELTDTPWRTDVPPALQTGIVTALRQARQHRALQTLRAMVPALAAAHAALDQPECARLLAEWREVAETGSVTVPVDLQSHARPVMDWVAIQARSAVLRERQAAIQMELQDARHPRPTGATFQWFVAVVLLGLLAALGWLYWSYWRHRP